MENMECIEPEVTRLNIETSRAIYEVRFGEIQVEITGRCNMKCQHCRGAFDTSGDMPMDQILKIIRFGRQFSINCSQIVLSGGEPLLHKDFFKIIEMVRSNGGDELTLTTNGSLFKRKHIQAINDLNFKGAMISVSLDSLDSLEHDSFRGYKKAFQKARNAIDLIISEKSPTTIISLRMTLRPHQLDDIPAMVDFAFNLGCERVSLSSVCPSGKAMSDKTLWMNSTEKKKFIETIFSLRKNYPPEFRIDTNDPLKCLVRGYSDLGGQGEIVFDGCPAAAVTFNVNANGDLTPCSLLNVPIMNIFRLTIEEMTKIYRNSEIVKNMLDMNLGGKCGKCDKKYQCGGCRARAFAESGDYMGEDPHCWIN